MLKRKDLLSITDLTPDEITVILDTAVSFKEVMARDIKKVPTLRGKTVINLFVEPSTRTRTSFELAAKRLSADIVNISSSTSSLTKGEGLLDMARNLEAMRADLIVLRHPSAGAPHLLARTLQCGVINAGDGAHEHPTQALLDVFTIRERKKTISGLRVLLVGDILHSRVARSDLHALKKMGAQVTLVGPGTMIPRGIEPWGVQVAYNFDEALDKADQKPDVIIMLRLQLERQEKGFIPSLREYSKLYGLTMARLRRAAPDALVMHPGPINRGIEIAPDVADSLSSVILDQVTNGVAVRMALLYLLMGGKAE
ncbi:MAG TPA: aspartate carbamoyltransferase catalytic subunit [Nitrospiria bacterium]|jgi:aspartate carbamoyltransferase catalytic subunit|nr:aspartate carbamoyltransferase catalytic subunit [Nitrospiria bacterium]